MGIFDKKEKKPKQISNKSIPPMFKEALMRFDSPLEIIQSAREIINLYLGGVLDGDTARTIGYIISNNIIPAYKLHMDQELLERYKRIEESLKEARARGSIAKSDLPRLPVLDNVEYIYEGRKKKE